MRIIPARAGFTPRPSSPAPGPPDHPRSRGVYPHLWKGAGRLPGSSPLARGLLPQRIGARLDRGIIPARAGFTDRVPRGAARRRDHPRSRGVYSRMNWRTSIAPGSSPLARGLHRLVAVHEDRSGIIPARAGFTPPSRRSARPCRDHPRSRGVYSWPPRRPSGLSGSSPLARGLPPAAPRVGQRQRIIPARAGFTVAKAVADAAPQDHPRSRGVYHPRASGVGGLVGSSPLARGLRSPCRHCRPSPGIIPARAGFTSSWPCRSWSPGDHPRSRGVYVTVTTVQRSRAGSSPLARGLPGRPARHAGEGGIIPARAGFTSASGPPPLTPADHPRSRGVYPLPSLASLLSPGSSPLARGLPALLIGSAPVSRIIPARAGFTS